MDEGIRIEDAACEISPSGLESLLAKKGLELTVTRLDLSISQEALNALLQRFAPGPAAPRAEVLDGRLRVENPGEAGAVTVELQSGGLRLEITGEGLRLRTDAGS
jgi:hypothetical protein